MIFFMKVVLISILILILSKQILAFDDPTLFCHERPCSAEMIEVSERFSNGTLNFLNSDLSAYSGACFHLDPNYDSRKAHYGVMAFQKSATNQIWINGFFGFFYDEDPYLNQSAEEISLDLLKYGKPDNGFLADDSIQLQYQTESTLITYWYRSSSDGQNLFLIGQSVGASQRGWENYVFCDLQKR